MALQRRRQPRPRPQSSHCASGASWRPLPMPGPQHDGAKGTLGLRSAGPTGHSGMHPWGTPCMGSSRCPSEGVCAMSGQRASCKGRSRLGCVCMCGGGVMAPEPPLFLAPPPQVFVVELLGRRILLLLGFSICCAACCVLTAALVLQVRGCGPHAPPPAARCPLPVARGGTSC